MDFRIILTILSLFVFAGCTSGPVCNKPYMWVGNDCCLDKNDNKICDKDEIATTTTSTSSTTTTSTTTITTIMTPTTSANQEVNTKALESTPTIITYPITTTNEYSPGYITLQNSVTVERVIYSDSSSINVSLMNSGNEAVYDVQISLLLPTEFKSNAISLGRMNPNIPKTASFSLQIDTTVPGVYPIALLTEYKDPNGYQFSSVTPNYLVIKESHSSQIDATLPSEEIDDNGKIKKITVSLRNMDQKDHDVKIRIYTPKELKINPEEKTLIVKAKDSPQMEFEISSLGALSGSSYVVFAFIEYDEREIHYSSTASGLIKVVHKENPGQI
jgi:hypothetical protein